MNVSVIPLYTWNKNWVRLSYPPRFFKPAESWDPSDLKFGIFIEMTISLVLLVNFNHMYTDYQWV